VVTESGSGKIAVRVIGEGPGSKLHPEALEGLAGRSLSAGLTGRWAPAYYLSAMTSGLGGGLSVTTTAEGFILEARLPA
jgi:hypothetical protein